MKTLFAIMVAAVAVNVAGCAIEQTHLLGTEWKQSVLDTNGTEGPNSGGDGKK